MWTGLSYTLYEDSDHIARDVLILSDGPWRDPDVDHETLVWDHGIKTLRNVHG